MFKKSVAWNLWYGSQETFKNMPLVKMGRGGGGGFRVVHELESPCAVTLIVDSVAACWLGPQLFALIEIVEIRPYAPKFGN